MSEYLGLAVATLRAAGRHIDDETLAHVWPTHHENVLLYGTHTVDIEGGLAGLDANGYRPLHLPIAGAADNQEGSTSDRATINSAPELTKRAESLFFRWIPVGQATSSRWTRRARL